MSGDDGFESDLNDLHGGFSWADAWVTVFFVFESLVLLISLLCYLCLLRVMAKNSAKEASINYLFLIFFFITFLVDVGLVLEQFLSNFGHQWHSTSTCQFVTFVTLGNRLLQAFGVLSLLYLTLTMMWLKSKKIENLARTLMPVLVLVLIVLELIFALPPAMNIQGSAHGGYCLYTDPYTNRRLSNWLFQVIFPYYAPLLAALFPLIKISLQLRLGREANTQRERGQLQTVLFIVSMYFICHFLYYLLWLGREIEAATLSQSAFQKLLGLHVWYITRPLFSLFNLGWHIATPLSVFIFDLDLLDEFPGTYVNKYRGRSISHTEDIVLQERSSRSTPPPPPPPQSSDTHQPEAAAKSNQWREFSNPTLDDDREYHQIPL